MDKKELTRLIDTDFPTCKVITQEAISNFIEASQRGYRTDVRVAMGLVFITEEYEKRRKEVLSMRIP